MSSSNSDDEQPLPLQLPATMQRYAGIIEAGLAILPPAQAADLRAEAAQACAAGDAPTGLAILLAGLKDALPPTVRAGLALALERASPGA